MILRTPAEIAPAHARRRPALLRGARRRARRDPRRRLRRGRARRVRPSRRVPRTTGAAVGRAVGAVEDPRAARDRRARAPAARRAARVAGADDRARRLPPRQHDARRPTIPGAIVAVLDWEMATLGDPLADVGLFLLYWGRDEARRSASGAAISPRGGVPDARRSRRALREAIGSRRRASSTSTRCSRRTSSRSSSRASTRGS